MSTAGLFDVPAGGPTISFELYPPRTPRGARELPATIAALAAAEPDFFSVTYGASGRTRDSSGALLAHILEHTAVPPIAHLTCVGASEADLDTVVSELLGLGVRDFLALRGDPPEGDPDWRPHPDGYRTAGELVALLRRVEARELTTAVGGQGSGPGGPVSIAVAAYPGGGYTDDGRPAVEPSTIQALRVKQEAGADYAITQVFYDAASYAAFVSAARESGIHLPIVPGVIPLTDPRRLRRLEGLTGVPVPARLLDALESSPDPDERYRRGLAASTRLIAGVLEAGAPGLHVYTFNTAAPALDMLAEAGLRAPVAEVR